MGAMLIGSLREIEEAFRSAWCRETCDESDLADWSPLNPSRGQCGVTALTLHDLFGGDLLLAEVHYPDGSVQGYHWWNRFTGGLEVDLTREQFDATEVVQEPRSFTRPLELPTRGLEQYLRLQASVFNALGVDLPDHEAKQGEPR